MFSSFSFEQLVPPLIAFIVGIFGYRIHERMRLQQYFGELRVWASSCLDCLSEAVHLCELDPVLTKDPDFFNRRHTILVSLSSYIDQGRWFFPSAVVADTQEWDFQTPKNLKQRPLDDLVYAYSVIKKMSYSRRDENLLLKAPMVEIKKDFTNSIQVLLDPKKAYKQFGLAMKKDAFLK